MIKRLSFALLRLYPNAWRERYEPEVRAVIEQSGTSRGDADRPAGGGARCAPAPRPARAGRAPPARQHGVMALYCWIGFVVVGAGFAKATEDAPFRAAEAAHGLLGSTRVAVVVLALAGAAVFVVAGAPIALRVLFQAYRGDRALRRALIMICAAGGGFALATAGVLAYAHSVNGNGGVSGHAVMLAWIVLGVVAAAVCGWSARRAIFGAELDWIELRAGTAGAQLLAWLMTALTVAVGALRGRARDRCSRCRGAVERSTPVWDHAGAGGPGRRHGAHQRAGAVHRAARSAQPRRAEGSPPLGSRPSEPEHPDPAARPAAHGRLAVSGDRLLRLPVGLPHVRARRPRRQHRVDVPAAL